MAKDSREILQTVRHGKTTFRVGTDDVDALAEQLSKEQIANLTTRGAISGFDAKADKAAETEAPEEAPAEEPKGKKK